MGFERLKGAIVPGFGQLATGDHGVDFRVRRLSEQDVKLWSFDATAQRQETIMFNWAIAFLIIALIAGLLGFGVIGGTAFAAAKVIFVVALLCLAKRQGEDNFSRPRNQTAGNVFCGVI